MNLDYSPTELCDYCTIEANDNAIDYYAEMILAELLIEKSPLALVSKLKNLLRKCSRVSLGTALEKLHSVATAGKELQGDADGVDALCYMLSEHVCKRGIAALRAVLTRFDERETKS